MKLKSGKMPGYGDPETWGGRSPYTQEPDVEDQIDEFLEDVEAFDEQKREHFYDALDLGSNFQEYPLSSEDPVRQYQHFVDALARAARERDYPRAGELVVEALRRYIEKEVYSGGCRIGTGSEDRRGGEATEERCGRNECDARGIEGGQK